MLTETVDAGQDPQRGGFLIAHPGKGTYIYVAFVLYRQVPESVAGACRLPANLLCADRSAATNKDRSRMRIVRAYVDHGTPDQDATYC